jgi:protease-4
MAMLFAVGAAAAWPQPARAQFDVLRRLAGSTDPVKQIVYFKVKGALAETPVNMPPLFGNEPPISLKGLIERFKQARLDPSVVAVVVDLQHAELGLAQLQEVQAEMRKFAAVDKPVFVHADSLSTVTYAASTGATQISIVPTGDLWLTGLYGATPYLRGTLDKIGCVPDMLQMGDYKSAGEILTRTGPSDESKEMTDWLLDSLYEGLVKVISDGRSIPPEKVRGLIDNGPYSADDALAAGLIDFVQHRQEFMASIKKRYGEGVKVVSDYAEEDPFKLPMDNPFAIFELLTKLFNPSPKVYTEPSVAIVFVEGTIQPGAAEPSPFGPASGAFSTTIRRALDKAADDNSVKAVVLRVDSPGGSALASEIILDASKRVAKKKPLVVSMGNVAGSGGYYVACGAKTIFADPNTITASIGVVGGKIVTTGMWNKLGVNWYEVGRGEMSGILSTAEPFSDAERKKIRHYMEEVYGVFKGHVTAARGDRLKKPIDKIAGGRVFTGAQALELGLVDKLGGLDDAIKFAASEARLGEYDIRVIPEPPSLFDLFMPTHDEEEVGIRATTLRLADRPEIQAMLAAVAATDPMRFRAMVRTLQRVELLHTENVLLMMPLELVVR